MADRAGPYEQEVAFLKHKIIQVSKTEVTVRSWVARFYGLWPGETFATAALSFLLKQDVCSATAELQQLNDNLDRVLAKSGEVGIPRPPYLLIELLITNVFLQRPD